MRRLRYADGAIGTKLLAYALFALLVAVPIGWFFARALGGLPASTIAATAVETLGSPRLRSALAFSTGQALLSAVLAVLIALPAAYLFSHYDFPGKRAALSLTLVPFVLPSIIVVIGIISFYGNNGVINRLLGARFNFVYNFGGIVLAHVFYNFSLAIRIIADGWQRLDQRQEEAAAGLGDRPTAIFLRVTLPLLLPSILTAFVLVFVYCFLSFGIVLVFGGAQFATLEVLIYRETYINLDLPDAAGIAAVQLLLSGLLIFTLTRVIGRSGVFRGTGARFVVRPFRSAAPITRIILGGYAAVLAVFLLGPLVGLIARSFADGGALSLENYRALFNPELSARDVESIIRSSVPGVILRSIGLALLSGTVTFVGAVLLAFSLRGRNTGASETIFQLPIGISTVTLAIGLRLSFGDLLPDLLVVVMGQVFITFPLVFRIVKTAVLDLPPDYLHSAESLGSSPFEALLRVGVPVLKRGLLNGYAYSLAIPFADFTIVLAATRGGLATFPVAIYRLIGFRSFDLALSMSCIYIAICLGLFLWIDTTSQRRRHRQ